ncbi:MAG: phospho-N-acetylmuramoyl-pentapeptide-transferase, partial [Thermoanaerobaculia bacterium]
MFYHLLFPLHEQFALFNVFRYITFRAAAAAVTAVVLSVVFGPRFIRTLRRLSIGQKIRDVGPESHQVKAGTPTMGGLLILFAVVIPTLLWANLKNPYVWLAALVTLAFGAIGFMDDILKVRRGQNLGLSARAKLLLQVVVAVGAGVAVLSLPASYEFEDTVALPFFKRAVYDLGIFYVPFVAVVL